MTVVRFSDGTYGFQCGPRQPDQVATCGACGGRPVGLVLGRTWCSACQTYDVPVRWRPAVEPAPIRRD